MQSIGGGFWLSTMVVLDALGIDPDKYKLNMRVIGDTGTVTQALITGNVDAMVVPYSYADMAKRAGAKALGRCRKAERHLSSHRHVRAEGFQLRYRTTR